MGKHLPDPGLDPDITPSPNGAGPRGFVLDAMKAYSPPLSLPTLPLWSWVMGKGTRVRSTGKSVLLDTWKHCTYAIRLWIID